jgi:hypothetical protein
VHQRRLSQAMRYVATLACIVVGCTSTETPSFKNSTIVATNSTCSAGQCEHLVIVGIVPGVINPGGYNYFVIGDVDSGTACLDLPDSVTVSGVHWTLANSTSLTALPNLTPGVSFTQTLQLGDTRSFVPAAAAGWQVSFPGAQLSSMPGGCAILNAATLPAVAE